MNNKEQAILEIYNASEAVRAAGGGRRDNEAISVAINNLEIFNGQTLTIPNPIPQTSINKPISIESLLALVPADKVAEFLAIQFQEFAKAFLLSNPTDQLKSQMISVLGAMASSPKKSDMVEAVKYLADTGNRLALKAFLNVLKADGKISSDTNTLIIAEIDATIDQPGYQATVPNPFREFVTPEEVQNALNS